jgi:glycosyltransferase involved in cell wall biosynthesis
MDSPPLFVSASDLYGPVDWRWIADRLSPDYRWTFVDPRPMNFIERTVHRPRIARYRTALQAAWIAKHEQASLIVTHLPRMSGYVGLTTQALRLKTPILSFTFNFTTLPTGILRRTLAEGYKSIERFVVPSTVERELYSEHFGIPFEKIDMLRWGVDRPTVPEGEPRMIDGPYLCALGGEGRDYATLVDAMRRLPNITLVIVARPHNLEGLSLPSNVRAFSNIPTQQAWNILRYAAFSVVPLRDAEVPCGHVTLVATMYMRKALIVTGSRGVSDYVQDGVTGLMSPPRDPDALAQRIQQLWDDPAMATRLGEAADRFVSQHCTVDVTVEYFRNYLRGKSLLRE